MKAIFLTFLIAFALISCKKDDDSVLNGNDDLVGNWINPQYTDTLISYSRTDHLIDNEPGFVFRANNTLICRQNSGWCGTPPITTADYDGTWNWNDSVVEINTSYWGGSAKFSWKVISLDEKKLVVWVAKTEYHEGK